jgi:hypothetical protein
VENDEYSRRQPAAGLQRRSGSRYCYQLQARQGDLLELQQRYPQFGFNTTALTDDDRRILDLSHNISERNDRVIAHRLDRLYLSHTSEKTVLKIGRQAVSWGNGIIYNPVDFFNPFDPIPAGFRERFPGGLGGTSRRRR